MGWCCAMGGGKWVTQKSEAFIEDGWTHVCMYGRTHYKIIRLEIN